ncbi:LysM peptidoglycan-binding domain-containing protein [Paenibacillus apiarius]|uniref:LysM peptidoglycan-binding domain-containing protein n=1 Tax=Paenibacillus apiarius TaxID=46240 RepID=UPI00198150C4|nr:LysM peptidoglycan-binding domain-containing protein [Paenibacillus apiarius]MBN3523099.1 LysM peptidoglycan-binding domain-containing protein [Paenibacillus apiarius]
MSGYHMYLSFNNQEQVIELPVNPAQLDISEAGNLQSFDIIGLGEVNAIETPKPAAIQFSSIFPISPAPYVHVPPDKLLPPSDYVIQIRSWMESKRPIRFVLTTPTYQMNLAMAIEKFTWREAAGSVGDLEYDLSLKQYKFYSAQKVKVLGNGQAEVKVQKAPQARADERQGPTEYTVQAGDKLWSIAKSLCNDESKLVEIQRLNGIRNDEMMNELEPGRILRIPKK